MNLILIDALGNIHLPTSDFLSSLTVYLNIEMKYVNAVILLVKIILVQKCYMCNK